MRERNAVPSGNLLGIFAKHWQPGMVKTRLAATIGNERAAAIHRLFVETLLVRLASLADERLLAFSPRGAQQAFCKLAQEAWRLAPQGEGDLGARIRRFFAAALMRAERVVLVGSDSPDIPLNVVQRAFDALRTHDVVLGPASDGGYYLVGAARHVPPIFDDVAWSTGRVWSQTIEQLAVAGCSWQALPPWHDVDDEAGLRALRARLKQSQHQEADLARLDRRLQALLTATA